MPQIKQISFNQFQDCFAVATDAGVQVFNSNPLVELVNLKSEDVGSVKLVALLNRSNLIAMVSGEPRPKFSDKTVMIWDNQKQKFVVELTVNSPILNLLITLSRVIVVQHSQVHVFSLDGFVLATHDETGSNPHGLCALSPNPKNEFLVYPSFKPGTIQVVNLRNVNHQRSIAPATIHAHESDIVKIAIDNQGTKIATGSIKGTIIRVFDTQTKSALFELKRGAHLAQLFCLRFSQDSSYLAATSDQGTLHVFGVDPASKNDMHQRAPMKLVDHFLAPNQQKSVKQFTMPYPEQIAECAFIPQDSNDISKSNLDLVAVTKDGYFYYFSEISPKPTGYELIFNLSYDQEFWQIHSS